MPIPVASCMVYKATVKCLQVKDYTAVHRWKVVSCASGWY